MGHGQRNIAFPYLVLAFLCVGLAIGHIQRFNELNTRVSVLAELENALRKQLYEAAFQLDELTEEKHALTEALLELEREVQALARKVVFMPHEKTAYLTFDDGPSHNTAKILDILQDYNIKATFFVNGNNTPFGRALYQRIVAEGHALGNHSYTHRYDAIYTSVEAYLEDHYRLEDLLYEVTGQRPQIMRFPGGSNNTVSMQYGGPSLMQDLARRMVEEGYYYYDWNVTSLDAAGSTLDTEVIVDAVLTRVRGKPNPIILFHDSSLKTTTVEALPIIIEALLRMGYTFAVLGPGTYMVQFI